MKANEAPEKLYVDVNDNLSDSILYGFTEKRTDEDIEYTRTDSFIERAEAWLRKIQQGFILTDEDITDFINYMEGE